MWGVECNSWVKGAVLVRNGVRVRIRRSGREVEKKRKKNKENTRKGQNVFIQLKIDKTKKTKKNN